MAIVANLANPGDIPDKSYCTWNRRIVGPPMGAAIPEYAGEIVLDITDGVYWRAVGLANGDWVAMTPRV
jgi:hypothetical protein